MNLREAILKGADKVQERGKGEFFEASAIEWDENSQPVITLSACAMGAAYLGCHPDVSATPPKYREDSYTEEDYIDDVVGWADILATQADRWARQLRDREVLRVGTVFDINDTRAGGRDWGAVLDMLDREGLAEVEVCDDPGEGGCT